MILFYISFHVFELHCETCGAMSVDALKSDREALAAAIQGFRSGERLRGSSATELGGR